MCVIACRTSDRKVVGSRGGNSWRTWRAGVRLSTTRHETCSADENSDQQHRGNPPANAPPGCASALASPAIKAQQCQQRDCVKRYHYPPRRISKIWPSIRSNERGFGGG